MHACASTSAKIILKQFAGVYTIRHNHLDLLTIWSLDEYEITGSGVFWTFNLHPSWNFISRDKTVIIYSSGLLGGYEGSFGLRVTASVATMSCVGLTDIAIRYTGGIR